MTISNMIINAKLKQQMILGACATLAVIIGITFIYTVWQWHNDWVLAHKSPSIRTVTANNTNADLIANLPNDHLFGQTFSNGEVPITNLGFHVTGIVKVEGGNNPVSKVYISISGQPSKIYQSGDNLPYGVKIYDITPDSVILENGGRLEKLPLPREKLQFKQRNVEEHM